MMMIKNDEFQILTLDLEKRIYLVSHQFVQVEISVLWFLYGKIILIKTLI